MEKIPAPRACTTDGHITLRRCQPGDEAALYAAVQESITELTPWGFYHVGFTLQDALEEVDARVANWTAGKSFTYLIEQQADPVLIGNCSIEEYEPEDKQAALGWWVRTCVTQQGIATAAGRLAAHAAFEDLQLNTLRIYTRVENKASRRVAEKLGSVLVQIKPEENGGECAVYELKAQDLT
jgi:RimJ/RimL family protein N-acetyltransferase